MKITQEVTAWLPSWSGMSADAFKDPAKFSLHSLGYTNSTSDMRSSGWVHIGTATITLEIPSLDTVINAKADSLRAEITKAKADEARTIAILEDQLSKLLALPLDQTVDAS